MKRVLCLTAYERPELLLQTLDSIAQNDLTGWDILIHVDPSPNSRTFTEVKEIIRSAVHAKYPGLPEISARLNVQRKGPNLNISGVIQDAFDGGADLIAFQQDDVLLSPDCLKLASWFGDHSNREDYLCLWHFNYESDPARPLDVLESRGEGAKLSRGYGSPFYSLGWTASRNQWDRFLRDKWNGDPRGCDWSISGWLDGRYHPQQTALVPAFSRNQHIGEEGTYTTAWYQKMVFENHPWNQENREQDFRLIKEKVDAS